VWPISLFLYSKAQSQFCFTSRNGNKLIFPVESGPAKTQDCLNDRCELPIQLDAATQALNLCAGVSKFNVLRGRSFNSSTQSIIHAGYSRAPRRLTSRGNSPKGRVRTTKLLIHYNIRVPRFTATKPCDKRRTMTASSALEG